MPTRSVTIRLPKPGQGLLPQDIMSSRGILTCRDELDAATIALMNLREANDPGFQRGYPLVTTANTAANFRTVLAHVDAVRTFHAEHLAWASNADMDLSDPEQYEALLEAEPDIVVRVAMGLKAKLYAVEYSEAEMRMALKAYERSRRVWWAAALVATVLAEPIVGLPVACVVGLDFGCTIGKVVEWWRNPARWYFAR